MNPITIIVLGDAVPMSHRSTETGRRYITPRSREFKNRLSTAAVMAVFDVRLMAPLDCALNMSIIEERAIPSSFSKKRRALALSGQIRPTTRPDNKNILAIVEDALTGIVYTDDARICHHTLIKIYGVQPKLTITVSPMLSPNE